jgi:hypothetical protein
MSCGEGHAAGVRKAGEDMCSNGIDAMGVGWRTFH